MKDLRQESVAGTDVGQWVIVVGGATSLSDKTGVDEGDIGKSAGGSIADELRDGRRDARVLPAPEGKNGKVGK